MKTTNKQKRETRLKGKVGIFWVYRGKLLGATYAVEDGEEYGDAINGLANHVTYWPQFQELHPELRELEYQDVPRGRVLFMKPGRKFCVYMDKILHKSSIKRALLQEFELSVSNTRFLNDAHYTTDPDDLERMFSDERCDYILATRRRTGAPRVSGA